MSGCASSPQPKPEQQPTAAAPRTLDHENIKRQAQELGDAMIKRDFNRAADLTHPKLIEMLGGRDRFISQSKESMKEMEAQQWRIVSIAIGEPRDIVEVKNEIYAIVPTTMRIKVPDGILAAEAFMIGMTNDGGQHWTFVDSAAAREDNSGLKVLFPDAADRLRIPEQKQPVFHQGLDQ